GALKAAGAQFRNARVPCRWFRAAETRAFPERNGAQCIALHSANKRSDTMKALYVAGFAAALFTTQAFAQAVVIAPEQRTVIRDYVVKEKIRPHRFESRVPVGAPLPAAGEPRA